jgi:hypothetical protein
MQEDLAFSSYHLAALRQFLAEFSRFIRLIIKCRLACISTAPMNPAQ